MRFPRLLSSQMATLKTALALLEQLRQASYDTAALELKTLRAFAASQVRPCSTHGLVLAFVMQRHPF